MLQLRYTLKRDRFQYATLLGDPASIRNLYWQLTHNYKAQDGQEIGEIQVLTLDGADVTSSVMSHPFGAAAPLSTLEN